MTHRINLIVLFSAAGALLLPSSAAARGSLQLTPISRVDSVSTAYSPEGNLKMDLREVRAEATGTEGPKQYSVFVLFEPTSGAFSWRFQAFNEAAHTPSSGVQGFNDDHAEFFKDGEIVDFWALMFRMYIRDYHGRASSMDDAETKALVAARHAIDDRDNLLGNGRDLIVVSIAEISNDFLYPPMSATASVTAPKVTSVRWDQGMHRWNLTLQGRWAAAITLDEKFKLLSIKRLD